jgi:hypothetical protein
VCDLSCFRGVRACVQTNNGGRSSGEGKPKEKNTKGSRMKAVKMVPPALAKLNRQGRKYLATWQPLDRQTSVCTIVPTNLVPSDLIVGRCITYPVQLQLDWKLLTALHHGQPRRHVSSTELQAMSTSTKARAQANQQPRHARTTPAGRCGRTCIIVLHA